MSDNKRKQTFERKDDRHIRDLRVYAPDHTPSWKSFGSGYASFRAYGHVRAEWLSLSITEASTGGARAVARDTMLTLDKPAALALRDLLNEIYPDIAPPPTL